MKKVILVLLFFYSALTAFASDSPHSRESLKGLKSIKVWASMEEEIPGLTVNQIQTDAELKLRMAGITCYGYDKELEKVVDADLFVSISSMKISDTVLYVYDITISLSQVIDANTDYFPYLSTWDISTIGYGGRDVISQSIRDAIKDGMDIFINAYLSVNPK